MLLYISLAYLRSGCFYDVTFGYIMISDKMAAVPAVTGIV
jgi:hypothetical protein